MSLCFVVHNTILYTFIAMVKQRGRDNIYPYYITYYTIAAMHTFKYYTYPCVYGDRPMSRQISIKDNIYELLKKQKGKDSFSDVIELLLNIQHNRNMEKKERKNDNMQ